ncbi:MAG: MFS transporter [Propionicimonas sp.]
MATEETQTVGREAASPPVPLWRNRPYTLLQSGKTAHVVGVGIGAFAIPLLAFQVTGSVAQAGLIAGIGEVGALLGTLPGGVVADRFDRRRIILIASVLGGLLWLGLAAVWWAGHLAGWHLAMALFGSSVAAVFANPAESGAIRAVVPSEQLGTAMAVVQGRHAVASLLAGPLGGFLYGVGHAVPLLVSAVGHLSMSVAASLVREPLNGDLDSARAVHPLVALRQGLRFIWNVRFFRMAMGLFIAVNIAFTGLIAVVNLELVQTGTDPILIGMLDLVAGGVMVLGALLAPRLLKRLRLGTIIVAGLGLAAAGTIGMALWHSYLGYLVMLALAVALVPAINAGLGGYTLAITPPELQGRVSSVLGLTGFVAAPIAPVLGAALLAGAGVVPALWVFAAAVAMVTVALAALPALWRIGLPESWSRDAVAWPQDDPTA